MRGYWGVGGYGRGGWFYTSGGIPGGQPRRLHHHSPPLVNPSIIGQAWQTNAGEREGERRSDDTVNG